MTWQSVADVLDPVYYNSTHRRLLRASIDLVSPAAFYFFWYRYVVLTFIFYGVSKLQMGGGIASPDDMTHFLSREQEMSEMTS